jgi:hypothetical protein
MSKRRKKTDSASQFAALMQTLRGEPDDFIDEGEDDGEFDPDGLALGDGTIDVEAEEVIDPNALPPGATRALPAGSETETAAVTEPAAIDIEAIDIEAIAITDRAIVAAAATASPTKIPGKAGRPRRLNAKPKNTNNGKRGRPATGKRSNRDWHGRTYYLQKQTDIILEDALFKLKRSGVEIDRSDLVDALLSAWAGVTMGNMADFQIGEIVQKRIRKDSED